MGVCSDQAEDYSGLYTHLETTNVRGSAKDLPRTLVVGFLDQMSVAKVMRSSTLALFTILAAARFGRSIHWTHPSNFDFLVHPQIMHCLKDITHTHVYTCDARIRAHRVLRFFLVHP